MGRRDLLSAMQQNDFVNLPFVSVMDRCKNSEKKGDLDVRSLVVTRMTPIT